jgi:hypothetical protein
LIYDDEGVANMTTLPLFSLSRTILIFSLIVLSACGGDGGVSKPVSVPVPPTTVMTVGAPRTDTVFFGGFNDYSVSVMPGALYKISITGLTDDADLLFFGTDSTFGFLASCAVDNTIIADVIGQPLTPEDCIVSAPGNVLFFSVDGRYLLTSSSATFTIDVELLTPLTTLNLSTPLSDFTTQTDAAAYSLSPTTTNIAYTISTTGLSDDADLYVFGNDGTFTSLAACSFDNTRFIGTTPEDCTLASSGGPLYFIVDGLFSSAATVDYTVLATPAPVISSPVNEGSSGSPVTVLEDTPSIGQVGSGGTSFYTVSGLTQNVSYTISVTGLTNDVDLNIPVGCLIDNTSFLGTTAEDCTFAAPGGTQNFTVSAGTNSGAAYIILVEPGP